jgi:murein hydrolase activator
MVQEMQQAEAQKKAAEAKEKWIKAQENTKKKQADLDKAKQQEEQARTAAQRAQDAREKLKQPVPSSAEASAHQSTDQTKQEAVTQKKAAEAKAESDALK